MATPEVMETFSSLLQDSVRKQVGVFKFIHSRSVTRPQVLFRDPVDNSNNPFIPRLRQKANARVPLPEGESRSKRHGCNVLNWFFCTSCDQCAISPCCHVTSMQCIRDWKILPVWLHLLPMPRSGWSQRCGQHTHISLKSRTLNPSQNSWNCRNLR